MSDKKREFNEALAELVELANVSANKISKEQINLYFKDILDDESKYRFIYEYLNGQKIEIEGLKNTDLQENDGKPEDDGKIESEESGETCTSYETVKDKKSNSKQETEEAQKIYSMYLSELKEVEKNIEEIEELLQKVMSGDGEAVNNITELYLENVISIAEGYSDSPMMHSDMVAEGNLALFEGIMKYNGKADTKEFEQYITEFIKRQIEKAIFEELGSDRTSRHLVERINALNDMSTELAKKLGREASLEELSKEMSLSEDEIKNLMKISIDALTIDENGQD